MTVSKRKAYVIAIHLTRASGLLVCVVTEIQCYSPSGLIRDCRYLSLDNFTAVKADPDAGAYAVVHIVSVLALVDSDPERSPLHLTFD
jgi:hypothetical protein